MIYEFYGFLHKTAKRILKKDNELPKSVKLIDFSNNDFDEEGMCKISSNISFYINEVEFLDAPYLVRKEQVYPVENLVPSHFDSKHKKSFSFRSSRQNFTKNVDDAYNLWPEFISNSKIPIGFRNEGCHYAGFIKECQNWCLPSWIWTNAAIVRYYCLNNEIKKAEELCSIIISHQHPCGGWIVRNDYSKEGVIPELAPNDSCYIALNACLSLFEVTEERKYLDSAERCASWIIETARPDGLVYFGFDMKRQDWIKDRNIVDTGFTAGLFAKLYEITRKEEYRIFLKKFIQSYIQIFYMPEKGCFATAVDGNDRQKGGAFGRGQGWALEGLIPAYQVLREQQIKDVIRETIQTLIKFQLDDGGWSYNLLNPLMGVDCKAVPVIAKCMIEWYKFDSDDALIYSANRALKWCAKHTAIDGSAKGGIFSYTIEGAIVHHMYTNTAFVYGSSYAAEVKILLDRL